jgi:hypothetical protein
LPNRLNDLEDLIYDSMDEQDDEIRAIHTVLDDLMSDFILHLIKKHHVKTLVYNEDEEVILSWKK